MKLIFSAIARRDVAEAVAYVSQDNPQAAAAQERLVRAAARRLLTFPALGRSVDEPFGLRALQVQGTPFRLFYRQTESAIVITRVWHGARAWPPSEA